jgi:hypothetical protein
MSLRDGRNWAMKVIKCAFARIDRLECARVGRSHLHDRPQSLRTIFAAAGYSASGAMVNIRILRFRAR